MLNPLKALKQAILPQPAFITPSGSGSASLPHDSLFDSDFDAQPPKPRLLTRIYEGLPGFVGGAAFMAATKCTTAALCSTVSAPALLTGAAVLSVGAVASQTLTYIRERKAALQEIAAAESPTGTAAKPSILRNLFNKEAVGRELRAFGQELKTSHFWKSAVTKGVIAGGLGAAFSFAAHNDTVQHYAHKAVDAVRDSSLFQKLTGGLFGKPAVTPAKLAAPASSAASAPAPAASAASNVASGKITPAPVVAAAAEPKTPVTLMEKARALFASKGVNSEAAEKMLSRTGVSEAQRVKDMAVGLGNGKYGFAVDQDAAKAAMKLAAENGNAQAARDLALNGRPLPVTAPAAGVTSGIVAPKPTLSDLPKVYEGATTQERAAAFIKENYPETKALAPATGTEPAVDADPVPPKPVGTEAARCVLEKPSGLRSSIRSLCSVFKDMVGKEDHVLMQDASGALSTPYIYDGDAPQETVKFMNNARRDFRDNLFMPSLQGAK